MVARGRPRQFRNAADRQRAYRERKKQTQAQGQALRNSEERLLQIRIRWMRKRITWCDIGGLMDKFYPERNQVKMEAGYSYCPCRHLNLNAKG